MRSDGLASERNNLGACLAIKRAGDDLGDTIRRRDKAAIQMHVTAGDAAGRMAEQPGNDKLGIADLDRDARERVPQRMGKDDRNFGGCTQAPQDFRHADEMAFALRGGEYPIRRSGAFHLALIVSRAARPSGRRCAPVFVSGKSAPPSINHAGRIPNASPRRRPLKAMSRIAASAVGFSVDVRMASPSARKWSRVRRTVRRSLGSFRAPFAGLVAITPCRAACSNMARTIASVRPATPLPPVASPPSGRFWPGFSVTAVLPSAI